jgi:hypothetical protein
LRHLASLPPVPRRRTHLRSFEARVRSRGRGPGASEPDPRAGWPSWRSPISRFAGHRGSGATSSSTAAIPGGARSWAPGCNAWAATER